MRNGLLLLFSAILLASSGAAPAPVQATSDAQLTHLVERMTSPEAGWQERLEAEKTLLSADPTQEQRIEVLQALFDALERIGPTHAGHPGLGSLRQDAEIMPPKAQVSYSIHRTWWHYLKQLPSEPVEKLLWQLFNESSTSYGKRIVLEHMTQHLLPEAEESLVTMLRSGESDVPRRRIAEVLLANDRRKYVPVILGAVEDKDQRFDERRQLFMELAEATHQLTDEQRRKLARNGFEILVEQQQRDTTVDSQAGYFVAVTLENATDRRFRPVQADEKYQTQSGLADAFFADTVANALAWWQENRESFAGH